MPPARSRLERLQSDDFRQRAAASRRSKRRIHAAIARGERPEPPARTLSKREAMRAIDEATVEVMAARAAGAFYINPGQTVTYTMTGPMTNNTWINWNNRYYETGTTNGIYLRGDNQWIWQQTGAYSTTITASEVWWENANEQYEETLEQKYARFLGLLLAAARQQAQAPGSEQFDLTRYLEAVEQPGYRKAYRGMREFAEQLTDDQRIEVEDAFQRAREERIERERAAERAVAQAEEAKRRAETLLLSVLSAEQKREWLEHKRVTEIAPSERVWRFFPLWTGSSVLMEGDVRRATLCIHPRERIPECDNIVAQIMALRAGEEDNLLKIAILHSGTWTAEEQEIRRTRNVRLEYDPQLGGRIAVNNQAV